MEELLWVGGILGGIVVLCFVTDLGTIFSGLFRSKKD